MIEEAMSWVGRSAFGRSKVGRALARYRQRDPTKTQLHARYPRYEIGAGSYGWPEVLDWNEGTTLKIGAYCSIAAGVKILLGGEHRPDWVTTFPFNVLWPEALHLVGNLQSKGDVVIGNDVWIGTDAMILSGVTISDGAVVGTRAVVTRDVPPYAFVAGVPAKVVKYRFDGETIAQLLRIKWWDWPQDKIEAELPYLCSADISRFIARHV